MGKVPTHITRRRQAQHYNTIIDQALLDLSAQQQEQVIQLAGANTMGRIAERIRRRATLLGKHHRSDTKQILAARDTLIMALYASMAPQGWACAWCDGASIKLDSQRNAAIGGIVQDNNGWLIAQVSHAIGEGDAFTAELAALAAVIGVALEHRLNRLCVYTDNAGLAQLWQEHRSDKRLAGIRELSAALERFSLHAIPRQHNQPANALAKQALRKEPFNARE